MSATTTPPTAAAAPPRRPAKRQQSWGERLLLPGLAEVSGVCTWPEFRGQGMAAALVRKVMHGFQKRGDRPFLHCYGDNIGAIRLYEKMGFRLRRRLSLLVLALA